jgi:hypothetical protein
MAIAAAAVSALVWLHPGIGHDTGTVPQTSAQPVAGDIAGLLQQVQVVDQIPPVDGYQRGCGKGERCVFGPAWNDPRDHSGCDTRNRLLAVWLKDVTFKPGTRNCKVIGGILDPDPYTGQRIVFNSKVIQIDHVVPLAYAYAAGAWKWDPQQRQIFANDPAELIPVSGSANRAKSDSGLDEWLPTFQPCAYIQRYLMVAVKYQLPITVAERNAATSACPMAPPAAA